MQPEIIEAPEFVARQARRAGLMVPSLLQAEVFRPWGGQLQVLVCTSPALRASARVVLVAVVGSAAEARKAFLSTVGALVVATGLRLPKARYSNSDGLTVFSADWAFRGEVRALIDSACSNENPADMSGCPSSWFASSGPAPLDAALAIEGHEIDRDQFKRDLYAFVLASDSVWQRILRKVSSGRSSRAWVMPLDCTVKEVLNKNGAHWEMQFNDLERLERAFVLVELRLAAGKAPALAISTVSEHVNGETEVPALRLVCRSNAREGRVQMARLIQFVLNSLDRMDFKSRPGQRALESVVL